MASVRKNHSKIEPRAGGCFAGGQRDEPVRFEREVDGWREVKWQHPHFW